MNHNKYTYGKITSDITMIADVDVSQSAKVACRQ